MIILDTSTISALSRINKIYLIKELFDKVVCIPDGVYLELLKIPEKDHIERIVQLFAYSKDKLTENEWLLRFDTSYIEQEIDEISRKYNLGIGESEVIALAKEKNGLAIIDDEEARDAAEKEGVDISGTLALMREHMPDA